MKCPPFNPTAVTLLFKATGRGSRWWVIGTAATYFAAIELGERAALGPGRWWLRTVHDEVHDDDHDDQRDADRAPDRRGVGAGGRGVQRDRRPAVPAAVPAAVGVAGATGPGLFDYVSE